MQANSPTSKLSGKIALVTGGTSGIGLATTKKFVAEGAYVFITGRRRANLDEALKTIGQANVTAINGDVGNLSDLDVLLKRSEPKKGALIFCLPTLEEER
jgi:NAD(P)-dependent dehydrogenase (short-subunit alcohol dehydrogenase family)